MSANNTKSSYVFLAFMIAVIFALVLTGCATSVADETPVQAQGDWVAESAGAQFIATIDDENITINLVNDDTESLYWQGTFGVDTLSNGDLITSTADREALDMSMLGSSSDTKKFTFVDDRLVFEFEMMGSRQTVKLNK